MILTLNVLFFVVVLVDDDENYAASAAAAAAAAAVATITATSLIKDCWKNESRIESIKSNNAWQSGTAMVVGGERTKGTYHMTYYEEKNMFLPSRSLEANNCTIKVFGSNSLCCQIG